MKKFYNKDKAMEEERKEYLVLDDNTKIIDIMGCEYTATKDLWSNQGFLKYPFMERSLKEDLICNKMSIVSIDNNIVKLNVGRHRFYKIPNWKWLGLSYEAFDGYQLSASLEYDYFIFVDINDNHFLTEYIKKIQLWNTKI